MVGTDLGEDDYEEFAADLDDFADRLRTAANEIETGEVVDEGMEDAVAEIANDIRKRAPVDTGELKESIHVEPQGDGEYLIIVGADHAVYQEYGTGPHIIRPTDSEALHFTWPGGGPEGEDVEVFAAKVEHPGHDAQPFVRPSLDENDNELATAILDAIEDAIDREL